MLKRMIEIRVALVADFSQVQEVFAYARELMYDQDNSSQWPPNYPSNEQLLQDILSNHLYVCSVDNKICGVFALIFGDDPTYSAIYDGEWLNDAPYATLHRVASDGQIKGLGRFVLNWCLERSKNLRVDTHTDNKVMLHLLDALGFVKCGVIYIRDGTPRVAFQKSI